MSTGHFSVYDFADDSGSDEDLELEPGQLASLHAHGEQELQRLGHDSTLSRGVAVAKSVPAPTNRTIYGGPPALLRKAQKFKQRPVKNSSIGTTLPVAGAGSLPTTGGSRHGSGGGGGGGDGGSSNGPISGERTRRHVRMPRHESSGSGTSMPEVMTPRAAAERARASWTSQKKKEVRNAGRRFATNTGAPASINMCTGHLH
jgi:hypothetical protein